MSPVYNMEPVHTCSTAQTRQPIEISHSFRGTFPLLVNRPRLSWVNFTIFQPKSEISLRDVEMRGNFSYFCRCAAILFAGVSFGFVRCTTVSASIKGAKVPTPCKLRHPRATVVSISDHWFVEIFTFRQQFRDGTEQTKCLRTPEACDTGFNDTTHCGIIRAPV